LLLLSLYGSIVFTVLFGFNRKRFAFAFCVVTFIQSLFIIYSYLSPDFRLWTYQALIQGGNIPLTNGTRVAGFTNSSGASLSLIQSLGFFSALYCIRRTQLPTYLLCLTFMAIVICVSTILTGRLGFFICLALVPVFVPKTSWQRIVRIVLATLLVISVLSIAWKVAFPRIVNSVPLSTTLNWAFEWVGEGQLESLALLREMPIPPLTVSTVIGTGLVIDPETGLNASGHDSGYIQNYYAMGLPLTVLFYGSLVLFGIGLTGLRYMDYHGSILLVLMLIVEIKEPFVFKYVLPFYFVTFSLSNSESRSIAKHTRLKCNMIKMRQLLFNDRRHRA